MMNDEGCTNSPLLVPMAVKFGPRPDGALAATAHPFNSTPE